MRLFHAAIVLTLTLIGMFGLVLGVVLAGQAWRPGVDGLGLGNALAAGSIPFLAGTIAMGSAAVVFTIEITSREQIAAARARD